MIGFLIAVIGCGVNVHFEKWGWAAAFALMALYSIAASIGTRA